LVISPLSVVIVVLVHVGGVGYCAAHIVSAGQSVVRAP
jgi:hypothetical protein